MNERPILFSAPMVRALLAGTKTQTRRALSAKLIINDEPGRYKFHYYGECDGTTGLGACFEDLRPEITPWIAPIRCPYGEPGDRLWVRETFKYGNTSDAFCTEFKADLDRIYWESEKADTLPDAGRLQAGWMDDKPWTPSIHMPRWASRILLEIVSVRCEQVQHISVSDVRAEGCELREFNFIGADAAERRRIAADVFGNLWVSINGAESWCANPWVWVVEFKRVQ